MVGGPDQAGGVSGPVLALNRPGIQDRAEPRSRVDAPMERDVDAGFFMSPGRRAVRRGPRRRDLPVPILSSGWQPAASGPTW